MLIENANIFRLTIYRTLNAFFAPSIYIYIYSKIPQRWKGTTPFKHDGPVVMLFVAVTAPFPIKMYLLSKNVYGWTNSKGECTESNLLAIGAHFANQIPEFPEEYRDQSEATNQETRENGIGRNRGMLLARRGSRDNRMLVSWGGTPQESPWLVWKTAIWGLLCGALSRHPFMGIYRKWGGERLWLGALVVDAAS